MILSPFITIGKLLALWLPNKNEYEVYYFFPFYHTGGAEKVHALITLATGNKNCIIYFTRKSNDDTFYTLFHQSGCTVKDISAYTDNKFLYFLNLIYRGILAGKINRQKKKPLVFNGQCNFAYKLSPWLAAGIPQVELSHSFNTFSWIRLPFLPFITRTVMISKVRLNEHLQQYEKLHVPHHYNDKLQHIVNGIPIGGEPLKDFSGTLQILYAGRGTEEKRVHLVAAIAKQAKLAGLNAEFLFMGEVQQAIPPGLLPYCTLIGQKNEADEIAAVYAQAHVVIITSNTEGFPMVIEEGMASGCAVLATRVGDIPVHVQHNINGFLFSSVIDEALIIDEGVQFVALLCNDRKLLADMSGNNRKYACEYFSLEAFNRHYQHLFYQLQNKTI